VDDVAATAVDQIGMAVEVDGEIERGPAGDTRVAQRVVAAAGHGADVVTAPTQRAAHAAHLDALATEGRLVVVADQGDAGHRWQAGQ
jgi:PDZ domain-containing secreted protein